VTDDFLDNDADDEDEDEESSEDESKDKDDAASKDDDSEKSVEKRISALQSKADKMEARANKAEKALKAKAGSARDGDKTTTGDVPVEVKEWLESARGGLRDDLYGSDERFKRFNLDSSLITGDTPAEMRASQKALIEFVDKMEGQIRDAVLVEHGFQPEPKTSQRSDPVNYKTMGAKEFAKVEAEILGSGELRRS
jgi:hypothetical protein